MGGQCTQSVYAGQWDDSCPVWEGEGWHKIFITLLHHATQNGMQFKTYELFISGIFHFIFSGHSLPWVTETMDSKTG